MDGKLNMSDSGLELVIGQSPEIKRMLDENARLNATVNSLKIDVETMKKQLADKVSKAVWGELENKILTHTKALDGTAKKMNDIQTNVVGVGQSLTYPAIEAMKKQIVDEMTATINTLMTTYQEKTNKMIDERIGVINTQLTNAKRVMFHPH